MTFEFKMPAGEPLKYQDWEFPTVPTPRSGPSFVDSVSVPSPAMAKTNKPFPEFAIIDPSDILHGIQSMATSFDKGFGIVRKTVPGVAGIGEALGGVGRAIESSPFGKPLGIAGQAITGGVQTIVDETMSAAGRRLGQIGENIADDPTRLLNPIDLALTSALGTTGSRLAKGQLDFSSAPRDISDSINLVGLVPAFKGAGMLIKGIGEAGSAGRFLTGVARAAMPLSGAGTAEKAGAITGRALLSISAAGLGADYALPKIAPNETWAQDILNNRVVAEDSPWRFPFEAATTLPMDLFALTKLAKETKLASWAHEKVFGPTRLLSQRLISDEAMTNAIRGGLITKSEVRLINDYGLRQYAEDLIVKTYNDSRFLRKGDDGFALSSKDLPLTQGELNQEIKSWVDKLYDTMGADRLHREAADKIRTIFGWDELTEAQIIREFPRYARAALEIEPLLPGRLVGVNTVNAFWQAPRALERLDGLKTFSYIDYEKLVHDFPALSSIDGFTEAGKDLSKIKLALNDYRKFLTAEKDTAEIASIRAQIRSVEKNMDDIDIRFGRDHTEEIFDPKTKKTTIRNPWMEAKKELIELEQRYAVLNAPSYFKLGMMERELDDLASQIIKTPTDALRYKFGYLQSQVKTIREAAASEHLKTIKMKQGLIAAREDAIRMERGAFDPDIVDAELETLNEGLENATEAYYNALMAGSRWHIEHTPKGPVMRLVDKLPGDYKLDPSKISESGRIFTALFGALPNKELGIKAWNDMRTSFASNGSTEEGMERLFKMAREQVEDWGYNVHGGYRSNAFVSIFHLPTWWWNNAGARINKEAGKIIISNGDKPISEAVFRAYPGPLKIFARQVFGKELPNIPYNTAYHNVTRAFYPMLRFFLSPRFLALNMYEAKFIGAAGGGPGFFTTENKWFTRFANELEEFGERTSHGFLDDPYQYGYASGKLAQNAAKLASTKRADEVVHAILDTVARRPEMAGVMKELGSREKWYDEIYKMFKDREAIRDARYTTTQELKDLSKVVKDKETELAKVKGSGDELRVRSELREATEKYDDMAAREALQKDAEAVYGADIKKYQPFMDAIVYQYKELIRAERMAFAGNPNRSATERLLNSFLLYWPISYQFKASKILAEFMFSRGFGYHTGSSMAATWANIRQNHEDKLKTDPEYIRFFKKNKDLLSFVRMFIPITPEDIGVSLSPFLRVPYHIAKGDTKGGAISQLSRLWTVGPLHDTNLVTEIAREQTKPGGLLHDIFAEDPDVLGLPMTGNASQSVDTDADATDREKDKERVLAKFTPELRAILSKIETELVPEIGAYDYLGKKVEPIGNYRPSSDSSRYQGTVGADFPSKITVSRKAQDYEAVVRHELLHGASFEYEVYRQDEKQGFPGLRKAITDSFGAQVAQKEIGNDPWHAFTKFGELAIEHPEYLQNADEVYRYFLPLRQGILTD